ncbi:uncharacterized protein BJ212DRAFT_1298942 [Suillus subaureus]|uniref:Uncharacterized protein n=1 Tax=Suillus subaureus TaxID=48587 RepID=A0A9P7EDE5_9AGAM|nr:uncharacterized protein BJ212DRAFT_1298942 [Suillus subaureus]KAG1818098.1 hypothetical protein BJ212DRAFT_1298942 [Suillus subaureus]
MCMTWRVIEARHQIYLDTRCPRQEEATGNSNSGETAQGIEDVIKIKEERSSKIHPEANPPRLILARMPLVLVQRSGASGYKLFIKNTLSLDSQIYGIFTNIPGMNALTRGGEITLDFDLKHILKCITLNNG